MDRHSPVGMIENCINRLHPGTTVSGRHLEVGREIGCSPGKHSLADRFRDHIKKAAPRQTVPWR